MKLFSKSRHRVSIVFGIVIPILFSGPAPAEPINIAVGVGENRAPAIARLLKDRPTVCHEDDYFSDKWLRAVVEFSIVCRAIHLGGLDAVYEIKNYPNSARAQAELLKGVVALTLGLPRGDFSDNENLYKSMAVLRVGAFVKGIYTRPDHVELLKARSLEELQKFTAVSNITWKHDWALLERMKMRDLFSTPRYQQMVKMVQLGRADFLLSPFPKTDELSQMTDGFKIVPVPGIKVVLPGSRHVAVSKKYRNAKRIFEALQVGLRIMHERGLVKKSCSKKK